MKVENQNIFLEENKELVWLPEYFRTVMIPTFLNTCAAILMVLGLMSQKIIVRPCWQGKSPEILLPAKTTMFSFIYHNLPFQNVFSTCADKSFLCLDFLK